MVLDLTRASQAELDNEIARLSIDLAMLKRHCNAKLPVSVLPPDVLLEIFSFVIRIWDSELPWDHRDHFKPMFPKSIRIPSYYWLSFTHVCHHWREVAIRSPSLWTRIILPRDRSTETMLNRSQLAPISLFLYVEQNGIDETLKRQTYELLRPHTHRVKLLQVVSANTSHDFYGPIFSAPMPSIQEIILLVPMPSSEVDYRELHEHTFQSWTKQERNSLRVLSFAHISIISLQAAIRPSLRHLSLFEIPYKFQMPVFLSILESIPLLESLTLINATPEFASSPEQISEPFIIVTLPHLHTLQITSPGLELVNLLHHVSCPAMKNMRLTLHGLRYLKQAPGFVAHCLLSKLRGNSESLLVQVDKHQIVCMLTGWAKALATSDAEYTVSFETEEELEGKEAIFKMLDHLASSLITESLITLHFLVQAAFHWPATRQAVVTKARNLENLHSSTIPITLLLPRPGGVEGIPLPQLVLLWIERISGPTDIDKLNRVLWVRRQVGKVLQILRVPRCGDKYEVTTKLVGTLQFRGEVERHVSDASILYNSTRKAVKPGYIDYI